MAAGLRMRRVEQDPARARADDADQADDGVDAGFGHQPDQVALAAQAGGERGGAPVELGVGQPDGAGVDAATASGWRGTARAAGPPGRSARCPTRVRPGVRQPGAHGAPGGTGATGKFQREPQLTARLPAQQAESGRGRRGSGGGDGDLHRAGRGRSPPGNRAKLNDAGLAVRGPSAAGSRRARSTLVGVAWRSAIRQASRNQRRQAFEQFGRGCTPVSSGRVSANGPTRRSTPGRRISGGARRRSRATSSLEVQRARQRDVTGGQQVEQRDAVGGSRRPRRAADRSPSARPGGCSRRGPSGSPS